MKIELIKYRSFGYQCPVALMAFDQSTQAYTAEGMLSLAKKFKSNADLSERLFHIYKQLESLKYREIDEIKFDDISGQATLF
jgi:hypothetical protein